MYNPIKNFEVCAPKVRQTIKIKNEPHKSYKWACVASRIYTVSMLLCGYVSLFTNL